ncbi:hypothetical protein [Vibrio spartinae]|uniref:Uncharacterized protein n=1 Tax=Vibrio spartinae TaxID=1918945 RepID=A0ABX6QX62_9VIBR|nr:hypothetical protein [Vibrio spartinae]QMV13592.1 hypothetical protein Vspart_00830 [Vibrio spartinae]
MKNNKNFRVLLPLVVLLHPLTETTGADVETHGQLQVEVNVYHDSQKLDKHVVHSESRLQFKLGLSRVQSPENTLL